MELEYYIGLATVSEKRIRFKQRFKIKKSVYMKLLESALKAECLNISTSEFITDAPSSYVVGNISFLINSIE